MGDSNTRILGNNLPPIENPSMLAQSFSKSQLLLQWVTCRPTRTWQNQQPSRSKEVKLVHTKIVTTGDVELGTLVGDDKKTMTCKKRDTRQTSPPKSPPDYPHMR